MSDNNQPHMDHPQFAEGLPTMMPQIYLQRLQTTCGFVRWIAALATILVSEAGLLSLASGAPILSTVTDDFSTSIQGWSVVGYPPDGAFGHSIVFAASGGNPGGFLAYRDELEGGNTALAIAPSRFAGDLRRTTQFNWDTKLLVPRDEFLHSTATLVLARQTANGLVAYATSSPSMSESWTTFSASLTSDSSWTSIGAPFSGTFNDFLSQVDFVAVRVEVSEHLGLETGIDNFSMFVADDPMKILRNSHLNVQTQGAKITADFVPGTTSTGRQVSLTELATALDVDGFNWQQTITALPPDITAYRGVLGPPTAENPNGELLNPQVVPLPILDPDPNLPLRLAYVRGDLDPAIVAVPGIDQYDANGNVVGQIPDNSGLYNNVGSPLSFFDSPAMPVGYLQSGEFVQFHTELVGIKDGQVAIKTGIYFDWRSNAAYFPGETFTSRIYNSVDGDAVLPEFISGGVFDVTVVAPEPSAMTLCAVAIAALIGHRHLRRRLGDSARST